MVLIDRNSLDDARKYLSRLFSIHGDAQKLAIFLSEKIKLAHSINPNNWNLNFDTNSNFIRFNVGHEYCIDVGKNELLVLCLKSSLPEPFKKANEDFYFRGFSDSKELINSSFFDKTPDCLVKVPNSIGVVFKKNSGKWLKTISASNDAFIKYALENTSILPQMERAHSVGAVGYLSERTKTDIPNPSFVLKAIVENEERMNEKLQQISDEELDERTKTYSRKPVKIGTSTSVFLRNPYVIVQAKRKANGICQDCGHPAPFSTRGTNEPFLEVHHIVPLAEDGEDTIENVVALCPNCHRKRHYGQATEQQKDVPIS